LSAIKVRFAWLAILLQDEELRMCESLVRTDRPELARCHDEQLDLCVALELIADELPRLPQARSLRACGEAIVPKMRAFASQWATASQAVAHGSGLALLLENLAQQDQEDIGQAQEIEVTIDEMLSAQKGIGVEAFGYLLRGFITARRRRVSVERALLGCAEGASGMARGDSGTS
jgi:DNA-binding transcriptional LysR family regulator